MAACFTLSLPFLWYRGATSGPRHRYRAAASAGWLTAAVKAVMAG